MAKNDVVEEFSDASFWKKVAKFGARVPFATDAIAMYYALRDPRTPFKHKAIITAALVYWIDPFDLVPDFIVSAGQLDDLTVVAAAFWKVRRSVNDKHLNQARRFLGKPEIDSEKK